MKRYTQEFKIKQILDKIEEGQFAVPQLQRNYVWDQKKIKYFIDSIFKGLPIGIITIWKTNKKNRKIMKKNHELLPPFLESNDEIWFVLDGQQRLATLYSLIKGEERTAKLKKKEIKINFKFFTIDLAKSHKNDQQDYLKYQKIGKSDWVSLGQIISKRNGGIDKKKKRLRKKASQIKSNFNNYIIPFLFIETTKREEAVESFVRINKAGKPLEKADIIIATAFSFDIRNHIEETQAKIKLNDPAYGKIDENILIHGLSYVEGNENFDQTSLKRWIKQKELDIKKNKKEVERYGRQYKGFERALLNAIDYLKKNFNVYKKDLLSYENMLLPVTLYFYRNKIARPKKEHKKSVEKWFWTAAFTGRYGGRKYHEYFKPDLKQFYNLGNGGKKHITINGEIKKALLNDESYKYSNTAIAKGLYLMLLKKGPKSLVNGEKIQLNYIIARDNRKNLHHIYPDKALYRRGVKTDIRHNYGNLCIQSENDNIRISDKLPAIYLTENLEDQRTRNAAMKSNLISDDYVYEKKEIKKKYKLFLENRWALIEREIRRLSQNAVTISA